MNTNIQQNIQQNMKSIEDWDYFMQETADYFSLPIDTVNRIALFFVAQQFYTDEPVQLETKQVGKRTKLRTLREHIKYHNI